MTTASNKYLTEVQSIEPKMPDDGYDMEYSDNHVNAYSLEVMQGSDSADYYCYID